CFRQLPLKALRLFYSSVRFNFTIYQILIILNTLNQPIVEGDNLTVYGIYKGNSLEGTNELPQIFVDIITDHSGQKW
ncbi:hypothetical protein ABGW26_10080, partial [Leuconostoc falkenbergense]|uniref:hypothetical protein n=1 Tax=Leuconostoc falkenbergense TaxID=2766470 RepID=UPI001A7E495D